jgi:hypothetical protein
MWLQAGGAACHSEDGAGGDTPEAALWRARYVDARLADARESITRALMGGGGGEADEAKDDDGIDTKPEREAGRKKDAPDESDVAGVRALLAAQAIQREMVAVTATEEEGGEEEEGASGRRSGGSVGAEGVGAGAGQQQRRQEGRPRRRWRVMLGRRSGAGLVGEALSAEDVATIVGPDDDGDRSDTDTNRPFGGTGAGTAPEAMSRVVWNAPGAPDPRLVLPPPAAASAAAAAAASTRRPTAATSKSKPLRWSDLRLYSEQHPHLPRRPLRRVALDSFASPSECRAACGAAVLAMEGLPARDGETTLAADEWDALGAWAGADAAHLAARLCGRTRRAVTAVGLYKL